MQQNCPATNGACLDTSMNMSMDTSVNLSPKEKEKRKVNRITEYIEDQKDRIRSYFRRRHVPLKRAFDMDLQCGTQTFLIQISDDIEECLYYGNDKLVQKFLSEQGLSLANVNDFIANGMFFEELIKKGISNLIILKMIRPFCAMSISNFICI